MPYGPISFQGGAGSPHQRADIQRRAGFDLGPPTKFTGLPAGQQGTRMSIEINSSSRKLSALEATRSSPAIDNEALAPAPSPVDVFALRCWARAYLWAIGELGLHEAVDVLAADAVRNLIDTDTAQKILADAFAPYRETAA
jgi:hypothetical protein